MDANGDGYITDAEISEKRAAMFDKIDADGDGGLTMEEMRQARRHIRDKKRQ